MTWAEIKKQAESIGVKDTDEITQIHFINKDKICIHRATDEAGEREIGE